MTPIIHILKYPDGDTQETDGSLGFGDIVDLNGNRLVFPLPNARIIAYRVFKISTRESKREIVKLYDLELVKVPELERLSRGE